MSEIHKIIIIYLTSINVATFITYGIDKSKAKRSKWRIREASLLLLAVLGGSIGALLGMKVRASQDDAQEIQIWCASNLDCSNGYNRISSNEALRTVFVTELQQ